MASEQPAGRPLIPIFGVQKRRTNAREATVTT